MKGRVSIWIWIFDTNRSFCAVNWLGLLYCGTTAKRWLTNWVCFLKWFWRHIGDKCCYADDKRCHNNIKFEIIIIYNLVQCKQNVIYKLLSMNQIFLKAILISANDLEFFSLDYLCNSCNRNVLLWMVNWEIFGNNQIFCSKLNRMKTNL